MMGTMWVAPTMDAKSGLMSHLLQSVLMYVAYEKAIQMVGYWVDEMVVPMAVW